MKDRIFLVAALAGLWLLAAACSSSFIQPPTPKSGIQTLAAGAASAELATVAPSLPATTANTTASEAPVCAATASCAALDAAQIPLGCVKKVPYTNVLVPKGTTFEVLDKTGDFSCIDSGVVLGDKQVITCHGKQLYAFQLKLANAACAGATLPTGTGQCQDGYGYDAAQKCCAPVSGASSGSTTVTVNLGGCPLPSSP